MKAISLFSYFQVATHRQIVYPARASASNSKRTELTRVDVGVLLHVGFLVESLAAILARIRSRI